MIFPNPKQRQTPLLTQVAFTPVLEDSNNYTMSLTYFSVLEINDASSKLWNFSISTNTHDVQNVSEY